jgi:hypothetical protein
MRKHHCNRPSEFWDKQDNQPKKPSKSRKKNTKGGSGPLAEFIEEPGSTNTDPVLMSDAINAGNRSFQTPMAPTKPAMGPPEPPNNGISQLPDQESLIALQKAIQQSPARALGCKESPIDVEENISPQPTRRLLFPSPRKPGEFKSLDDKSIQPEDQAISQGAADQRSKNTTPTPSVSQAPAHEEEQLDKENYPPPPHPADSAMSLFEFPTSPLLSTPNGKSLSALLKTPSKPLTPLVGRASPMVPCSASKQPDSGIPQTPSRLVATGLSPFSAHMAAGLLSDLPNINDLSPTLFRTPVGAFMSPSRWKAPADDGGFDFSLQEFEFSEGAMVDGTGSGALEGLFDLFEDQDRITMGGMQEGSA